MASFRKLTKAQLQSHYDILQTLHNKLGAEHNALGARCFALVNENAKLKAELEELKKA
jgi:hypothetical protein